MTMDPEIEAMVVARRAQRSTGAVASADEIPLEEWRTGYRKTYRARSLPPDERVATEELVIPGPAGPISARLYRPPSTNGVAPGIAVYFHGGGFVLGDADAYDSQSRVIAMRSRCLILFPEFRLAPEHPFPAALDDAIAAVEWAAEHAAELGADAERLAVMGDSGGANLATNVAIAARDRGRPPIALQYLLYPWVDARPYRTTGTYASIEAYSSGFLLERATMVWLAKCWLPDATDADDPRVSPILATDLGRLPRAIVRVGEFDPLRDMGSAYAARLVEAGTPVDFEIARGMVHNFLGHAGVSKGARAMLESVGDGLRRHLMPAT